MNLGCRVVSVTRHEEWDTPRVELFLYSHGRSLVIDWSSDLPLPEPGSFWTLTLAPDPRVRAVAV